VANISQVQVMASAPAEIAPCVIGRADTFR